MGAASETAARSAMTAAERNAIAVFIGNDAGGYIKFDPVAGALGLRYDFQRNAGKVAFVADIAFEGKASRTFLRNAFAPACPLWSDQGDTSGQVCDTLS